MQRRRVGIGVDFSLVGAAQRSIRCLSGSNLRVIGTCGGRRDSGDLGQRGDERLDALHSGVLSLGVLRFTSLGGLCKRGIRCHPKCQDDREQHGCRLG